MFWIGALTGIIVIGFIVVPFFVWVTGKAYDLGKEDAEKERAERLCRRVLAKQ